MTYLRVFLESKQVYHALGRKLRHMSGLVAFALLSTDAAWPRKSLRRPEETEHC